LHGPLRQGDALQARQYLGSELSERATAACNAWQRQTRRAVARTINSRVLPNLVCSSCLTQWPSGLRHQLLCLCGLVVRVPGYTTEMYCVSCEVRTEFIYVM
jgi:hypothetical protein